jgi:oligopeptide transport system substrate-binding protein
MGPSACIAIFTVMRCLPAVLLLLFFSCRHSDKEKDQRTVFSYNEINALTSLDPAAASTLENIWPVNQLYNGLVEMDDSLLVRPSIARTWTIDPGGTTYTFRLRQDVFFHDDPCFPASKGRKVNARDFLFTFRRLYDARVSSASSLLNHVDRSKATEGFAAPDDSTFVIHLRKPFSAFTSILTMKFFSVLPAEAVRTYGDNLRSHPVGTGPFVFKLWDEGTRLVLHKNHKYFEKDEQGRSLPYLDAVSISYIRDRETAFMELLNGRFDMLSGADAFNTSEVLDRQGQLHEVYAKKFILQKASYLKTDYIGIYVDPESPLVQNSPLRFKKVRQAINYAFDRGKLVKFLRSNLGTPATSGFMPPGVRSFDPAAVPGYTYDPARARQLLAEAGFPGGRGLPLLTMHVSDIYREQVEFMQSQFAACGIPVDISVEKNSVLRQAVNRGEYLLFKKSWVADYGDEENFMSLFYSRNFAPEGVNYFHYRSARFDSLYEAASVMAPGDAKTRLFQEMERQLVEDAPFIAMYYDDVVRIISRRIEGLTPNPMNLLNLKRTRKNAAPRI